MSTHKSALAVLIIGLSATAITGYPEAVTWDGDDGGGDQEWKDGDANSWSGSTYDDGDTPYFTGSGIGTVTVVGTVTPGTMTFSGGPYTIEGGIISGSAGLTQTAGDLALSNTNTYSGNTTQTSSGSPTFTGSLTFHGKHSVSPNTKLVMGNASVTHNVSLLMDDAGTVDLGIELEIAGGRTDSVSGTAVYTVHVGNDGGVTTGSTIGLGLVDFAHYSDSSTSYIIKSTGANGYRLQISDVNLAIHFTGVPDQGPQGFYSDTAPMTITGTVKQVDGNSGNTIANTLFLGGSGTTTTNYITGTIADPDDYPANSFAQPLGLKIGSAAGGGGIAQSDAIWALSGENTFTGPTAVNYGTLIIAGGPKGMCLSDTASLTIQSNGKLVIQKGSREKVGSLFFGSTEKASGEWGSSASGAINQNDTYFSGEGLLYVGVDLPPLATVLVIR